MSNGYASYVSNETDETVIKGASNEACAGDEKADAAGEAKVTQSNEPVRETWASKTDFILSAVGFAVGFGNIWRFPYLCYANGGGAFLIPYVFMMTFLGMPLFYLELAIGQYASLGAITVWRLSPMFKGIGYAMIGMNLLVAIYYNVILALSVFYFAASLTSTLPWSDCGHWWNQYCSTNVYANLIQCNDSYVTNVSTIEHHTLTLNNNTMNACNETSSGNNATMMRSPAEEYWLNYVLGSTSETNIGNVGEVRWHLALCLLLAWIIVFLCIVKGIKTSGKVVYFTATFPYLVLFILLIRSVTLPGAATGVAYYLYPDFSRLATVKVWKDAAVQILFSLGPGFGNLIMLGSYNKFNNKCNRDAIAVTLINCGTSLFAGFVIFSILGFMADRHGVTVDLVVDKGPGLAFMAYPEAVAMMPGAPFWSICFFFMLITLGLDSQFVGIECIVTALMDEYAFIRRWKKTSTLVLCCILYLVGLPCVTQGGMFVVELIDKFTTTYPLLIVTMLEAIVLTWIYGVRRLSSDIESMIGHKPNYFWLACWTVISPLILLFILIFSTIDYAGIEYGGYKYPPWSEAIGWLLAVMVLLPLPAYAIYSFCRCVGSCQNICWIFRAPRTVRLLNLRSLVVPDELWGPALESSRSPTAVAEADAAAADTPDVGYAVAYHEGRCFVTNSAFYSQSIDDSHI